MLPSVKPVWHASGLEVLKPTHSEVSSACFRASQWIQFDMRQGLSFEARPQWSHQGFKFWSLPTVKPVWHARGLRIFKPTHNEASLTCFRASNFEASHQWAHLEFAGSPTVGCDFMCATVFLSIHTWTPACMQCLSSATQAAAIYVSEYATGERAQCGH